MRTSGTISSPSSGSAAAITKPRNGRQSCAPCETAKRAPPRTRRAIFWASRTFPTFWTRGWRPWAEAAADETRAEEIRPRGPARARQVELGSHLWQDRDVAHGAAHALDLGRFGPLAALKVDPIERIANHQPADAAAL